MILPCINFDEWLGLDVKRDPKAGNYKVSYIGYAKYFKRPKKIALNDTFQKRIIIVGKGLKKALAKIPYSFEIIDSQLMVRPNLDAEGLMSIGCKVAIRFENENDWQEFKQKMKDDKS